MAGIGLAALLVGCGAGQITQTDTQQSEVNGASGQVGAIAVRNAELQFPDNPQGVYQPGSSATLVVTIANTGILGDQLLSVSSPAATSVTIDGSATGTKPLPGNFSVSSGVDVDDSTADVVIPTSTSETTAPSTTTGSPSSGSSTTGTTTGSKSSTHGSADNTSTPATTKSAPATPPGTVQIVLTGIRTINGQPLRAGLTIPMTFTFARAGQLTIAEVPIGAAPDVLRTDTASDIPNNNN